MSREEKLKIVSQMLKKEGAVKVSVFGSYAIGSETKTSDIDILVKFASPHSLMELSRIERELGEAINTKVDLITDGSLSPYIRESIENELLMVSE
ncbi:MAG: nucleotidyltransferase family protein [Candidatus Goldbacteria bacterium]|nr:nucleotidyltransferase family protein [Candidatus Goldiibacteriota bacterium]